MAEINQTDVKFSVNNQEAVQALDEVRARLAKLQEAWLQAANSGDKALRDKIQKQINATNRDLRQMESGTKAVERVFQQLNKATPVDLNRALKHLQSELKTIERGTPAWNAHIQKIRQVKAEIDKVNAEMKVSESFLVRMRNGIQNWGVMAAGAAGGLTGVVMAGKKAVQTYAEMQQEEANVRKYTGMTEEQVTHLNEAFKQMDTRTSREELNKLAQEAGRLGLQSEEDVLGFVRAADKINVALDDLGEGATLTLSKLTDIFGDKQALGTERSLLAVGSVINELSQNSTAAAPYLAEFAQRLAGVGAQAHMTIPEIMGFGAVLDSQGQKLEMSSTALSKVIMNLFKDPAKIASATGLAVEEFSETCKKSTNEGLLMLLERLHELGGIDSLAPVFADMGENGARASAVLAALAGNVDMVRQQQEAANVAFNEAVSIDKEFEVQNTTVQAGLEKARKRFTELAVELGEKLMPVMRMFISSTSMTMKVLSQTIDFVIKFRSAIVIATAAITAYYIAMKWQDGWNALTGGIKKAIVQVRAFNAALMANPYAAVVALVAAAATGIALLAKNMRDAAKEADVVGRANAKAAQSYNEQKAKVDQLTAAIHNENLSLQYRQKALRELQAIVPGYHASLTAEGKLINDNRQAIDDYLVALDKKMKQQAYQEMLEEQYRKKAEAEMRKDQAVEERTANLNENGVPKNSFKNSRLLGKIEIANADINAANEAIDKLTAKIAEIPPVEVKVATPSSSSASSDTGSSVPPAGEPDPKALKDQHQAALDAVEDWKKRELAIDLAAYAQGEKSFSEHQDRMKAIELEYHEKRLALMTEGSTEYLQEEASLAVAQKAIRDADIADSKQSLTESYADKKRMLDQQYMDGEMNHEVYTRALEELELKHLQEVVGLYKIGSEEYLDAEKNFRDKEHEIQKKRFDEYKKIEDAIKKTYFTSKFKTADPEEYAKQSAALEQVHEQLRLQAQTDEERLKIDKAYYEAKYLLAREYNQKEVMENINSFRAMGDEIQSFLESELGQNMTKGFSGMVSQMSQIFSGLTSYIEAETKIQTNDITEEYDKRIKAAGKESAEGQRLEEEKNAEIAKINTEAAKKKFNMQVIETVATGIQSAVNAWNAGWQTGAAGVVLAPIFMAMSLAATGIQIAALKKQRDAAASTGYASGGYTKPGKKYEPAGIVHAGEWVASQELLANPTAAATIAQLDYAQKTNTIGQLSKPAPVVSTQSSGVLVGTSTVGSGTESRGDRSTEAIDRLNKTLDGGIYAATLMTGDKGIVRAQRRYNQLVKNKSAK